MTGPGGPENRTHPEAGAGQGRVKSVYSAGSEVEAVMLQGMLEDAGIPVFLRSQLIPGYGVPYAGTWADLMVPDERAAEARRLIEQYLASLSAETS